MDGIYSIKACSYPKCSGIKCGTFDILLTATFGCSICDVTLFPDRNRNEFVYFSFLTSVFISLPGFILALTPEMAPNPRPLPWACENPYTALTNSAAPEIQVSRGDLGFSWLAFELRWSVRLSIPRSNRSPSRRISSWNIKILF